MAANVPRKRASAESVGGGKSAQAEAIQSEARLEEQSEAYRTYVEGCARLLDSLHLYHTKTLNVVKEKQSSQSFLSSNAAMMGARLEKMEHSKLATEALFTVANVHRDWTANEIAHHARSRPIIANYGAWMRDFGQPGIQEIRTMQMAKNQMESAAAAYHKKQQPERKKKLDQTKERYETIRDALVTSKFNTMEKTFDEHRELVIGLFKEMQTMHSAMISSSEAPFTSLLSKLDEIAKKNEEAKRDAESVDGAHLQTPPMARTPVGSGNKTPQTSNANGHKTAQTAKTQVASTTKKAVMEQIKKPEPVKDDGQYECLDNVRKQPPPQP